MSDKTGTIAVADTGNNRTQMFSSDGNFLREITLQNVPSSLAFTDSGDIINIIPRIPEDDIILSLFTEGGQLIKHINNEQLKKLYHLSLGSDGRIVTCDWADRQIKVLSPHGDDLLRSFSAPDCDSCPWCAVYHKDQFFVSFPAINCVKVFNNVGAYLYDIGCEARNFKHVFTNHSGSRFCNRMNI